MTGAYFPGTVVCRWPFVYIYGPWHARVNTLLKQPGAKATGWPFPMAFDLFAPTVQTGLAWPLRRSGVTIGTGHAGES